MSGSMKSLARRFHAPLIAALLSAVSVTACTKAGPQVVGYVVDETALSTVKPGQDAQKVLEVLGTPSTVSTVGSQTWYYISQDTTRTFMFDKPEIVNQRVIAVQFTKAMRVEKLANYGMQDGVLFDFLSNTTPTGGNELTFIRQLMRAAGAGVV